MKRRWFLLAALALAACSSPQPPRGVPSPSPTHSPGLPSLTVRAVGSAKRPIRIVQTRRNNTREYELLARTIHSLGAASDARVGLTDVRVTFTARDGSTLVARSPRAIVDERDGSIEMTGGVRAENKAGVRLTCRTLIYRRGAQSLHGSGAVHLYGERGMNAVGRTVDAYIALSKVRIE